MADAHGLRDCGQSFRVIERGFWGSLSGTNNAGLLAAYYSGHLKTPLVLLESVSNGIYPGTNLSPEKIKKIFFRWLSSSW
jgi:hypothetical protein